MFNFVDVVGDLPTILIEMDTDNSFNIEKTYIYADSQILAQHDGDTENDLYLYLHDRLGSVRMLVDATGSITKNIYTYLPFGQMLAGQCAESIDNPFKFTGQWFDNEFEQWYFKIFVETTTWI